MSSHAMGLLININILYTSVYFLNDAIKFKIQVLYARHDRCVTVTVVIAGTQHTATKTTSAIHDVQHPVTLRP